VSGAKASRSPARTNHSPIKKKKGRISHGLCHLSVNAGSIHPQNLSVAQLLHSRRRRAGGAPMSPTPVSSFSGAAAASAGASSGNVTTDEFLQLLVAEIQNQDPTSPMDGTTFLTQLAQFQQVEQGVTSGQDLSGILTDANSLVTAEGGTPATQS
jgi:hypothetical protein